jgi:hypothetical protein
LGVGEVTALLLEPTHQFLWDILTVTPHLPDFTAHLHDSPNLPWACPAFS